jgi:hypothetical protein
MNLLDGMNLAEFGLTFVGVRFVKSNHLRSNEGVLHEECDRRNVEINNHRRHVVEESIRRMTGTYVKEKEHRAGLTECKPMTLHFREECCVWPLVKQHGVNESEFSGHRVKFLGCQPGFIDANFVRFPLNI